MQPQRHACLWVMVGVCALFAHSAGGEVRLLDPIGGEILRYGNVFRIEWAVLQYQPVKDWDLYYSITGPEGEWLDLALDLYPGDVSSAGCTLWYDWTIPDRHTTQASVKIVRDGLGGTWEDISEVDFTILPEPQALALLTMGGFWQLLRRRSPQLLRRPSPQVLRRRSG